MKENILQCWYRLVIIDEGEIAYTSPVFKSRYDLDMYLFASAADLADLIGRQFLEDGFQLESEDGNEALSILRERIRHWISAEFKKPLKGLKENCVAKIESVKIVL